MRGAGEVGKEEGDGVGAAVDLLEEQNGVGAKKLRAVMT